MFNDLGYVYKAFVELNNSRSSNGHGPQPISISEIQAWIELAGISDADERLDFLGYIQHLDETWMKYQFNERQAKKDIEKKRNKEKEDQQKIQKDLKRASRER